VFYLAELQITCLESPWPLGWAKWKYPPPGFCFLQNRMDATKCTNCTVNWMYFNKKSSAIIYSAGSGSFWASRIRIQIRNYLCGSGSCSYSFHQKANKLGKSLVSTGLWVFINLLSLKTVVFVLTVKNKQKTKKNYFCWHLQSHWRKGQDPDPDPHSSAGADPRIRLRLKMSRIRNTGKNLSETKWDQPKSTTTSH
jgi:hypothetical protein